MGTNLIKKFKLFVYKEDCHETGEGYGCEMMIIAAEDIDEAMQLASVITSPLEEYMYELPNASICLCNPRILDSVSYWE